MEPPESPRMPAESHIRHVRSPAESDGPPACELPISSVGSVCYKLHFYGIGNYSGFDAAIQ